MRLNERFLLVALVLVAALLPANAGWYYATAGSGYLVSEDAEGTGTPSGWSDAGSPDWDETGTVLVGSQSFYSGDFTDYSTKTFAAQSAVSVFLACQFDSISISPNILYLLDSGGGQQIRLRVESSGAISIRDPDNGTAATSSTGVITVDTTYYVWVDATKGTGANASVAVYVSTTTTKPSVTVSTSAGEWATDVEQIRLRGIGTANTDSYYDYVRVASGSGNIGSAPP